MDAVAHTLRQARPRARISWAVALVLALILNMAFFGLMPGLVSKVPSQKTLTPISNPVRVDRLIQQPRPEKKKPRPMEKPNQKPMPTTIRPASPMPIDIKIIPLAMDLNPVIPATSVVRPAPRFEAMTLPAALPAIQFDGVFDETDVDVKPAPVMSYKPVYPLRAERMGVQGVVVAEFTVTKDGHVKDIRIISATPKNVFEQSVIKCVSSWRFSPGKKNGHPVETRRVRKPFRFQLEN